MNEYTSFQIINRKTGKLVATLKTIEGARTRRDKEDEKVGKSYHSIRPVL